MILVPICYTEDDPPQNFWVYEDIQVYPKGFQREGLELPWTFDGGYVILKAGSDTIISTDLGDAQEGVAYHLQSWRNVWFETTPMRTWRDGAQSGNEPVLQHYHGWAICPDWLKPHMGVDPRHSPEPGDLYHYSEAPVIRYVGFTTPTEPEEMVAYGTEAWLPLDPRLDVRNGSPSGFMWGYGGSGPHQTALALLCDATENPWLAQKLSHDFVRAFVAGWDKDGEWDISEAAILAWVYQQFQQSEEVKA